MFGDFFFFFGDIYGTYRRLLFEACRNEEKEKFIFAAIFKDIKCSMFLGWVLG